MSIYIDMSMCTAQLFVKVSQQAKYNILSTMHVLRVIILWTFQNFERLHLVGFLSVFSNLYVGY
jgi:hypothetical protein